MSDLFSTPAIATQPIDGEKGRRERGAFYTPDALARAITRSLGKNIAQPRTILEPGCGGGAFLRAAHEEWSSASLLGVDTVPACVGPGRVEHRDLFTVHDKFDLIVGNPDFGVAEQVVRHCMALLEPRGCLALLLRISFLCSLSRVPLYREFPLRFFQPIAGRPSFTGGGSDTSEYGLFVWKPAGWLYASEILPPLEWK
jgi:hypothetical protein